MPFSVGGHLHQTCASGTHQPCCACRHHSAAVLNATMLVPSRQQLQCPPSPLSPRPSLALHSERWVSLCEVPADFETPEVLSGPRPQAHTQPQAGTIVKRATYHRLHIGWCYLSSDTPAPAPIPRSQPQSQSKSQVPTATGDKPGKGASGFQTAPLPLCLLLRPHQPPGQ